MAIRYLLAAEVDKIQSFVFRSTKLREIVGASYLLERFCENVPYWLNVVDADVLTSAGGSFRLVFPSREEAEQAMNHLRNAFETEIGGLITIAKPTEYDGTPGSLRKVEDKLRQAKLEGDPPEPAWHLPVQAICASCGVGLATAHVQIFDDERPRYLCATCQKKAKAGRDNRNEFFNLLLKRLTDLQEGSEVISHPKATDIETYAEGWDERRYVAYLKADGNGMGALISHCPPDQRRRLSEAITETTMAALAGAVHRMIDKRPAPDRNSPYMPALPLILGGDDVLVLLPASWAFDVARRFCDAYQQGMTEVFQQIADQEETPLLKNDEQATISVAVVICKENYPYRSAHDHAERLLERVKDQAKADPLHPISMLATDLIAGSQTQGRRHRQGPGIYSLTGARKLLDQRYLLGRGEAANRTLARLRADLDAGQPLDDMLQRLEWRVPEQYDLIKDARADLGDPSLLDLLTLWDFTYDLQHDKAGY